MTNKKRFAVLTLIALIPTVVVSTVAYGWGFDNGQPTDRETVFINYGEALEKENNAKKQWVQANGDLTEAQTKYDARMDDAHIQAEQARVELNEIKTTLGFQ